MNSFINTALCPACNSGDIEKAFVGKDYSVSGESFDVYSCNHCTLRFTQDIPTIEKIGSYYSSENYISHTNTTEGIVNRLYHWVRLVTMKMKSGIVVSASGKSSGKLLDIGAGTGTFVANMAARGWMVTGLEPDENARKVAYDANKVELLPIEVLKEMPNNEFDVITLWHVLEHVHELHSYLERIKALLKSDGVLFVAVPNYTSKDARYYKNYWAAYDLPRHLYHFSPQSIKVLMHKHQLQVTQMKPMWFDSFYVSMLSEKYLGSAGLLSLFKGIVVGFFSNLLTLFKKEKCSSVIYVIRPVK